MEFRAYYPNRILTISAESEKSANAHCMWVCGTLPAYMERLEDNDNG